MDDSNADTELPESWLLDYRPMDQVHRRFWQLYRAARGADRSTLAHRFELLRRHSIEHFDDEQALMRATAFPAAGEHRADHQRLLGEMDRIARRLEHGRSHLAREWLRARLPDWVDSHLRCMDSALAAHARRFERAGTADTDPASDRPATSR